VDLRFAKSRELLQIVGSNYKEFVGVVDDKPHL
jgi:hypothetical protein